MEDSFIALVALRDRRPLLQRLCTSFLNAKNGLTAMEYMQLVVAAIKEVCEENPEPNASYVYY